jgi:transcriptional regulator with XRE-family HTH domain
MNIDEDTLYRRIGAAVRQHREAQGMSQTQLATAVGLLRTSIANLEAGRQRAPLHTLYPICIALGIEIVDVLPSTRDVLTKDSRVFRFGADEKVVPARTAAVASELLGDDLPEEDT